MPHTISFSESENKDTTEDYFDFAEDRSAITDEISHILNRDFLSYQHQIIETNAMNKYLAFASELHTFSMQHQLNELALYASALSAAVKKFDTQKVKELLQQFPQILGEYYTFTN